MPSFKYLNGTNTIGTGTYKFKHINYEAPATNPYLTFSSPTSFTIAKHTYSTNDGTVQYSTNKTTWGTFTTTAVASILNGSNYEVYLRGIGNTYVKGDNNPFFVLTGTNVSCNGNIETLLDYATVDAGNHPTMASNCYQFMFYNCTSLTSAPSLPATTLADYCYYNMFRGCTSLTSVPSLPATTLTTACYQSMFNGCTSLTSVPALPATTLATDCYQTMFSDCTSLTTAPSLPATTLADFCYQSMFYGCASLTSAPALPATTLTGFCYSGMFSGCTSLTSAPALPATTLADYCYKNMFRGCTSLKLSATQTGKYVIPYRIPTSGTGTNGYYSLDNMFTSTGGTFTGTPTINTTYYLWSE